MHTSMKHECRDSKLTTSTKSIWYLDIKGAVLIVVKRSLLGLPESIRIPGDLNSVLHLQTAAIINFQYRLNSVCAAYCVNFHLRPLLFL